MTTPADRIAELRPYVARAKAFSGWDHSAVRVKTLGPDIPWDFETTARAYASAASRVLDLGTGGGERYAGIARNLAANFVASEAWGVNARVAYDRLLPLGIPLVWATSEQPPFAGASFELVLSRHEAVDPDEVDRMLASGGRFLTQQVMPNHWPELRAHFPRQTVFERHDQAYPAAFRRLGYEVTMQTLEYHVAFETLGDLVFMLITAPWEIPDFDFETEIEALLALERACLTPDGIVLSEGRYMLAARKPA